ncbi:RsmF rRNA methyltransferase first C-terminal domain-containing protein [Lactobacillus sp. YT155]|uniref:RsmB/NOP family class I SAM-dependent RNA methyltransferase n=1 Tax=Lactobacillus sp. YT155 TaxID=3060955 RepID=UPI00265E93B6|nr:RsmF rRNA methyltransferase first C-terminal domain-containing protein [Lactobacillus sp. YT155]MDO1605446.1 RsmF rRNA methyltransferase first C-terminal domain-containing protein [Lactobacillus sp. YT155]
MTLNLPTDFQNKYQELLGDRYETFQEALNQSAVEGFRLNPLKENFQDVKNDLSQKIEYSDFSYFGKINGNSLEHLSGYLYSQDPSAMYVGEVLNPQPGERVLDLCAAPGSKTTYLASKMQNKGLLVANEINTSRAKILSYNVERMGITNTVVLNNRPDQLLKDFSGYFDKIVVDAPCSGEGLFRKDPDAIDYWSLDYVEQCANRQREILKTAFELLKPGGTIVYSTCTFAPEEDEKNAMWFADNFDLRIQDIKKYFGMEGGRPDWCDNDQRATKFLRMFPDQFAGEGHFISKFVKSGELKNSQESTAVTSKDDIQLFNDFSRDNLKTSFSNLKRNNDHLEATVIATSQIDKKVKILRNGLRLGTFKKNRFEPDHALILAIRKNDLTTVIELTEEQYKKYLHGETVIVKTDAKNSWIGVSYQSKLFSWGKLVNQTIKNFYPKGLRQ